MRIALLSYRIPLALLAAALLCALPAAGDDSLEFWKVHYNESPTEGGSSGSALLNADGQVIGQLWGGSSNCNNVTDPASFDLYGKFHLSWDRGLSGALGDGKTISVDGRTFFGPADRPADPLAVIPGRASSAPLSAKHTVAVSFESIQAARTRAERARAVAHPFLTFTGFHVGLPAQPEWERLEEEGTESWRMAITAPGARTMRVHVSRFDRSDGAFAVAYTADPNGPVRALRPTDTPTTDGFWSPLFSGDTVFVEVVGENRSPALAIDRISYGETAPGADARAKVGDCYIDATCLPSVADYRKAVGQMVFETPGGGQAVCTGTLLADQAGTFTPWFLTANHCIGTEALADSLIVSHFFYTATCNGEPPDTRELDITPGASVVATSVETDFTLLELDRDPPAGSYYLGWTTIPPSAGDEIVTLHHPAGTFLRGSPGEITGEETLGGASACESLLDLLLDCNIWFEEEEYLDVLAACEGEQAEYFECIAHQYVVAEDCDEWLQLIQSECEAAEGDDDDSAGGPAGDDDDTETRDEAGEDETGCGC